MKKRVLYFLKQAKAFVFKKQYVKDKFSFSCKGPFGYFYSGKNFVDNCEVTKTQNLIFSDKCNFRTFIVNFNNSLNGVSYGYFTLLRLKGVGYRAWVDYSTSYLILVIGYSHYLMYKIPNDVLVKAKKSKILVFGVDKIRVSQIASEIQLLRKPDIYKGKGIQYVNRDITLKVGKQR